jgi:hypothetical protein
VRLPELVAERGDLGDVAVIVPGHLVREPRRRRRLGELVDRGGELRVARVLRLLGQFLAAGREVLAREGVQLVGGVVEVGHTHILPAHGR